MKNGFSLIELLCVLAVLSTLAALTYPSYTQYIIKAQQLDGQTALLDLARHLEHHYLKTGNYKTATLPYTLSAGGHYKLFISHATMHYFRLSAIRINPKINKTTCHTLTLDANGYEGPSAYCWRYGM